MLDGQMEQHSKLTGIIDLGEKWKHNETWIRRGKNECFERLMHFYTSLDRIWRIWRVATSAACLKAKPGYRPY